MDFNIPVSEKPSQGEESREPPQEVDELVVRQQAARAYLRKQYLQFMEKLKNRVVTFHMYENTTVTATFQGCDKDVENFAVSELSTPLGIHPAAILRADDVISFTVNDLAAAAAATDTCDSAIVQ
uniref:Gem-associated protein 7 n=1 Tax=Amblyomma maculatum TaxID=34609 RepID=G3MS89_AMBMU